ncbi:hypothetical protein LPJ57_005153 [Coemansia sp. RSA 486]|nr:hypothetical protein LPJ57_005153 [Coemansia sp. RSA 486]KAJ2600770.1 hypothetical protein GGF39_001607 [Coemansia sp. RSA 1721]KAJ2636879.1 hypothetical protein GGF40_002737 [Coemansia sp. RSA 1286]
MDIPATLTDVSQFREVPDHQEVYASTTSDQNLIVEILEPVVNEHDALTYHFDQVAEINDSSDTKVVSTEPIRVQEPLVTGSSVLVGCQRVAKFNEQKVAGNSVWVLMALLNITRFDADILVTMNLPAEINPLSSSFATAEDSGATEEVDLAKAKAEFVTMVGSLVIKNAGLFG